MIQAREMMQKELQNFPNSRKLKLSVISERENLLKKSWKKHGRKRRRFNRDAFSTANQEFWRDSWDRLRESDGGNQESRSPCAALIETGDKQARSARRRWVDAALLLFRASPFQDGDQEPNTQNRGRGKPDQPDEGYFIDERRCAVSQKIRGTDDQGGNNNGKGQTVAGLIKIA